MSYKASSSAGWEKSHDYYCNDAYDIISMAFLHFFKDPNSGKGPGGVSLPNINLANHCDTTFATLADPQLPTSGLLKVRAAVFKRASGFQPQQCAVSPPASQSVAASTAQHASWLQGKRFVDVSSAYSPSTMPDTLLRTDQCPTPSTALHPLS